MSIELPMAQGKTPEMSIVRTCARCCVLSALMLPAMGRALVADDVPDFQQAVQGALRRHFAQHSRQPPPHRIRRVRINQGVDQLAFGLGGSAAQRRDDVGQVLLVRQQGNHMGYELRIQSVGGVQSTANSNRIIRTQISDR